MAAVTFRWAEAAWEMGRRDNYQAALEACLPQPGEEDLRGFEWHYLWRLDHREVFTLHHAAAIESALFVSGGARIISKSVDNVKLWDLEALHPRFVLRDLAGPVRKLWLSDDGNRMLTGIGDDHVQLWDVPRRRLLATYAETVGSAMRFAPGGKWFWTVAAFRKLTLRNSATGRTLGAVEEVNDSIASNYTLDARRIYIGSNAGVLKIYEMPSLRLLVSFKAHPTSVAAACLSPDGKTLATCDGGGQVKLWDSSTLRELSQTQCRTDRSNHLCSVSS